VALLRKKGVLVPDAASDRVFSPVFEEFIDGPIDSVA
jgi:hypothetical protein